jgi:hypothetical protein
MDGGTLQLSVLTGVQNATRPAQGASTNNTLAKPALSVPQGWNLSLSWGQAVNTFESYVAILNTLAGAASVTYDLFDGSLSDVTGVAAPFRTLQFVAVYQISNAAGTAGSDSSGLTVGNAAANAHAFWLSAAATTYSIEGVYGFPFAQGSRAGKVVDATHRNLKILNADAVNTATYVFCAGGRLS